jgi:hypothetical protein
MIDRQSIRAAATDVHFPAMHDRKATIATFQEMLGGHAAYRRVVHRYARKCDVGATLGKFKKCGYHVISEGNEPIVWQ